MLSAPCLSTFLSFLPPMCPGKLRLTGTVPDRGLTSDLISMGVSADDDGLGPAGDQAGDVLADDGFPKHGASEDVPDGAVG